MRRLFLLSVFSLVACAHSPKLTESAPKAANLSQSEAEWRAQIIKDLRYDLKLDLTGDDKEFSGFAKLSFQLADSHRDLRLDFYKAKIIRLLINGQATLPNYDDVSIQLPKSSLRSGNNTVEIEYSANYSTDAAGLVRFQDPEDQRVYLHSQFQTYYANRVFPCFDQPDLKAVFSSEITAPKAWQVISTTLETTVKNVDQKRRTWIFPESAKISPYVFSLHAGPYKVWTSRYQTIPLRLFARQSLARYVNPQEWFGVTQQGLQFFNAYFDYPYPYKKYDQIIAPNFGAGAMENVGAVTFNEFFVSRGKRTRDEKRSLANVILHEMAHMWFGNLVTMKWWNDLWLNESFATHMSYLASVEATPYREAWRDFSASTNQAAWEDQLETTHPIEGPIKDVLQANTAFDAITYGKGAAVLRQLDFLLGSDNFRAGVRNYFRRYAGGNTVRSDFIMSLAEASNRDLMTWQDQWLLTANINEVGVDFKCSAGRISEFNIHQKAPASHPVLRTHAMKISFYQLKNGRLIPQMSERVEISGENMGLEKLIGANCPDLVYPNAESMAYFRTHLDEKSLATLKNHIADLPDPALRQMVWNTLWDMVKNARFSYIDYAQLALRQGLAKETDEINLHAITRSLTGGQSILSYYDNASADQQARFKDFWQEFSQTVWRRLKSSRPGSETQAALFNALIDGARTPMALQQLADLYKGKIKVAGLEIDQDRRWMLLKQLVSLNFPQAELWISGESKRDPSAKGADMRFATEVSVPRWEAKQRLINEIKKKDSRFNFSQLRMGIWSAFPTHQMDLRQKYTDFFKDLKLINAEFDDRVAASFASLAPVVCRSDLKEIERAMRDPDLKPLVIKRLRRVREEVLRCRRVLSAASDQAAKVSF